jgi:acetolactate synthase I/II/III large subunit
MKKIGADLFLKALTKHRVKHIFGYSGGSVMPLFDTLYNHSDIKYYINSNEQNVGHAATGYAKSSNKTGVALVTSGPGITNIITPMLDATNDSTPLVVVSGQVSKSAMGTNAFQEAPAVALSKNVTKWSYQVENANDIMDVMTEAFRVANDKKKGAVHIDIPKCVSTGIVDNFNADNGVFNSNTIPSSSNQKLSTKYLKKAIKKINESKSPIIVLGQGCVNYSELATAFIIKSNIPTTSTIHGCGIFNEHHPLSLRWCGMHGSAAANYATQEADCIIALGSRFDDRTTGLVSKYAPKAIQNKAIIHVNIEPSEINKVIDSNYNFNMDCGVFLKNALQYVKHHERPEWINHVNHLKDQYDFKFPIKSKKMLNMEYVLDSIYRNSIDRDVIFTTGVGNHQMQAYQYIKSDYPKKIISSGSLGVMGAGLPYAIGAQIANPNKIIVAIDGDSSFNMTCTDLKTIREHNLNVKIAIMNNESQMMVTIWEQLFYNERYTATINKRNPDFTQLAKAYGIHAISCDNYRNLESNVKDFFNYRGPILCEFKIERDICLPLVGPGKALDDMLLPENYDKQKNNMIGIAPS